MDRALGALGEKNVDDLKGALEAVERSESDVVSEDGAAPDADTAAGKPSICSLCKGSQHLLTTPLHVAAEGAASGDIVRLLLSEDGGCYSSLSSRRYVDQRSPLSVAVNRGSSEAAVVLLDATVNNSTISDEVQWNLLLHEAAQSGLTNVVDTLCSLSEACDLDLSIDRVARVCGGILTPLECALRNGHANTASCLLAHGADPHIGRPLLWAIRSGKDCCNTGLITTLLAGGCDVNMILDDDDNHTTPLLCAASLGRTAAIELLLSLGANVDDRGVGGRNALSAYLCAVRHRRDELEGIEHILTLVASLSKRGTSLTSQDDIGRTALHHTLLQYRRSSHLTSILSALLTDNMNAREVVNLSDHEGTSSLHLALSLNTRALPKGLAAEVTKLLLDAGADPNTFNGSVGPPPLLVALCNDRNIHLDPDTQLELASILLQKGAYADEGDGVRTPLMAALFENDRSDIAVRAMNLLLQHGCNIDAVNKHGETVLHRCIKPCAAKNNWSMVELLLEHGADPNQCDRNGYTSIHIAAESMSARGLHLLLWYGAKKDARTDDGDTALHLLGRRPSSHGIDLHQDLPAAFSLLILAGCSPNILNLLGSSPLEHLTRTWIRCAELADRLLSKPLSLRDLARARIRLLLHPSKLENVAEVLKDRLSPELCTLLEGEWLPEREVGGLVSDEDEDEGIQFDRSADSI